MHEKLRQRLLGRWAEFVAHHPYWVLGVAALAVAASVAITLFGLPPLGVEPLGFQSDRNELISEDLDWNQHFISWHRRFDGTRDLIIVVDPYPDDAPADEARMRQARALADALGMALEQDENVAHVSWRFDTSALPARGIRMLSREEFDRRLAAIAESGAMLQSPTLAELIDPRQFNDNADARDSRAGIDAFREMLAAMERSLEREPDPDPDPAQGPLFRHLLGNGAAHWQYLTSDNDRLLLMQITPRLEQDVINELAPAIRSIRELIAQMTPQYPDVRAGLTGIEVVEADETDAAVFDSTYTSAIAVVLIATVLILAFHSWRTPLLAVGSLLCAIACSFGYLTIAIGHLQIISVVFTVILLGLGIAYGIFVASRFELVRHDYPDDEGGFALALRDTLTTMGPGVATGAVTTAAAFITTMFTDFTGVAEMGHVAGAGVLLCAIAMFSVFPALLRVVKPRHRDVRHMEKRVVHVFEERWLMPFSRHPKTTLLLALLIAAASLAATTRMAFDYDLMALLPEGVESVEWQKRVADVGGRSIWSATSIAGDMDEARTLVADYRRRAADPVSTIDPEIGGVGRLFPPDEPQRLEAIAQMRTQLAPALKAAGEPAPEDARAAGERIAEQLNGLRSLLRLGTFGASAEMRTVLAELDASVAAVLNKLAALDETQRTDALAHLQEQYAAARLHTAVLIEGALDASPLSVDDLPAIFRRLYRGSDGSLAVEVYPRLSEAEQKTIGNPLDPSFLPRFVRELRGVDPAATGVIVQYYLSGALIKNAYQWAGFWALIVVFLLVWIDFQSAADALMSLLPVSVGFAVTFGVMWLIGMRINPANIIVLPLMFGIGVDAGVHVLHRYRQDPSERPLGLTAGTGKGITLTSFTTMIGFGALMLAHHRGIRSLGFVLALGIGMTMLACWIVMPAALELRQRRHEK